MDTNPKRLEYLAKQAEKKRELIAKMRAAQTAHKETKKALKKAQGAFNKAETEALQIGGKLAALLEAGCYIGPDGDVEIGKSFDGEWKVYVL